MVNFDSDDFSFEVIMDRMLDRIPLEIDKREGSVVYNALAPAAAEMAQQYIWMDQILSLAFADTAVDEFLDLRAREVGITRFPATHALYGVDFAMAEDAQTIEVGTRFMVDDTYFEYVGDGTLKVETPGEAGNTVLEGTELLPLDNVVGLETVTIGNIIQQGNDAEDDDSLRQRYFVRVRREANSGNRAHYKAWAEAVDGVGMAKVFPLHDGPGTVKIAIVNRSYRPPIQSLVNDVKSHIDPQDGNGEGQAPIGATVTVIGASSAQIDINSQVELEINRTTEDARVEFSDKMTTYLESVSFREELIRLSKVNELLLACDSIRSYANTTINGIDDNYTVDPETVVELGAVELGMM